MYEATCHECGRDFRLKHEPRDPKAWRKCPRCRRAITRVVREVRGKERREREYREWRQRVYNVRRCSVFFETARGAMSVDAAAGGASDGDVYEVHSIAGFNFRMAKGTIDDDELYREKYVEGWRKLIRKYTPRGTRKIS